MISSSMLNIIWPFLFCIRHGNLGKMEPGKFFRNFKWLTNREDGSDFDDFWTKRIAALSAKIWQIFGPSKKFLRGRKRRKTFAKSSKRLSRVPFRAKKKWKWPYDLIQHGKYYLSCPSPSRLWKGQQDTYTESKIQTTMPWSNAFSFGAADNTGAADDRPAGRPAGRSAGRSAADVQPDVRSDVRLNARPDADEVKYLWSQVL